MSNNPGMKPKEDYMIPMPPTTLTGLSDDSALLLALSNWCWSAAQVYNSFVTEVYSRLEKLEKEKEW